MGQTENDLNRLLRAGDEASRTNLKLIDAAMRTAQKIANAVPEEWVGKDDMGHALGMGYYVKRWHGGRELRWVENSTYASFDIHADTLDQLKLARQLANDIAAGFLKKLCAQLEAYCAADDQFLTLLQDGECQIDKIT